MCLRVSTIFGDEMQIDCGSESSERACNGIFRQLPHLASPSTFVLSHFHIDHYNGLIRYSMSPRALPNFRIKKAYYPRLPDFPRKEEFLCEMFAMNRMIFGNESGLMEYDFLDTLSRLNRGFAFEAHGLSKGNSINVNGSVFEVLWPPRSIENGIVHSLVEKAMRDFEIALEEDEELQHLYQKVRQEETVWKYFRDEPNTEVRQESNFTSLEVTNRHQLSLRTKRNLPASVTKANKSLKNAANHFSLSLFEDNRFLFLGDAENFEIERIISELRLKDRLVFQVFVTPHHGSHWHKSLESLRCSYSVTSNGSKRCSKFKEGFKIIANSSFATFTNGDIILP